MSQPGNRALSHAVAAREFGERSTPPSGGVGLVEQAAKLRPVGFGSARPFAEHLARPVLPQRRRLSGDALNVGPDPRVPVNHWCILHLYPVSFSPLIWCRVWVDC